MASEGDIWRRYYASQKTAHFLLLQQEEWPEGVIPSPGEEKWTAMNLEDGRTGIVFIETDTISWQRVSEA